MKKRDFQKGAISVFLVIILIPCIVISATFVDLSRVKLAQGVASSSADLALNSLMSNYDTDLNDYYGLIGSCQNIEDFYEEASMLFLESLYSQGLSDDEAESLLTYTMNLFDGNKEIHDLFQMEVQTETKDLIGAYKGGNSTEASLGTSSTIIKDQIVDFMKYRAPIEILSGVIKRLKDSNAASVLGEAEEDEQLVEDKKAYAEAEEGFMDAAFKTYKALLSYEGKGMTVDKLKTMMDDAKKARETYREISKLLVSNFNGTDKLKQFYRPTYKLDLYKFDKTDVYSRKEKDVYYIDGTKITSLLDDLEDDINDFKNKRKAITDKVGDTLVNASIGSGADQYNPIQWWKKVDSIINSGYTTPIESFEKSADEMLKSYAKVLAIEDCELGKKIPAGWEQRYKSLTQSVKDLQKDYLTAGVPEGNTNNKYLRLVNKLEKYSKENINKTDPNKVKLSNGKTVASALKSVNTTLSGHISTLKDCIEALDKLIDGGGILLNDPYSLNALSKKADEYHNSFKTWKNNAKGEDTKMHEADYAEINKMESEGEVLDVSKQDILDFKTRLVDVRTRLKEIKTTLESMKFGSKKIVDIEKISTMYDAVKGDIGENLKNSAVNNKANSIFSAKFTPYTADKTAAVKAYDFAAAKYDPNLNNEKSKPDFYTWLKEKFREETKELDEQVKEKKKLKEDKKTEDKSKSDEAKNKNRWGNASKINLYDNSEKYASADFPSELDANNAFELGESFIGGLADLVTDLVEGNFDSSRDALYSTEYVMDMFSYSTYENEGKYNLYKKNNKGKAPSTTGDYSEVKDAWASTKLTDTYNQTLTNKKINSKNNVLMNAEAEYVLYGETNSKNIKSAYGDIFAIRYLLNTLSGFQHFWSDLDISGIATSLSSLTSGIVPAPVFKCIIILILTAFETGEDLNRLQDGFPVEFYKSEDDWRCVLEPGDLSLSPKSGNSNQNKDSGLFYSDYLYLFLYLGFKNEKSASEMYRRTADLVQVNMREYTKDKTYMLKKARSYFELNATIRVDPLMLTLPSAQEFSNNPKDKSDWCTFKIHEIRGYS